MISPTIFTGLKKMRGQECDRPMAMATELAKTGAIVVATPDYDTLYVWSPQATPQVISVWHSENNPGDNLIFHQGVKTIKAAMRE